MQKPNIVKTSWPESLPKTVDEKLLSVVCGNSHLHWSFHKGISEDAAPTLFWRTPHLKESDLAPSPSNDGTDNNEVDTLEVLSRHLPPFVHDYLFEKMLHPR